MTTLAEVKPLELPFEIKLLAEEMTDYTTEKWIEAINQIEPNVIAEAKMFIRLKLAWQALGVDVAANSYRNPPASDGKIKI